MPVNGRFRQSHLSITTSYRHNPVIVFSRRYQFFDHTTSCSGVSWMGYLGKGSGLRAVLLNEAHVERTVICQDVDHVKPAAYFLRIVRRLSSNRPCDLGRCNERFWCYG